MPASESQMYLNTKRDLTINPVTWLITGAAGFIGSHLTEQLLLLDQQVIGLDNFSTGGVRNLEAIRQSVADRQWKKFSFIEGDIRDYSVCCDAAKKADFVLHQAALGSVPRSLQDPISTNGSNITGFLNMLTASKECGVRRFCYAASSSTYGDHSALPKVEDHIGAPLSPYAVTKLVNELYSKVFESCFDFQSIGLRYFNVFGPRQSRNGAYAAVIPRWIDSIKNDDIVVVNGDGLTSRDFCYVENVVEANILAAAAKTDKRSNIYNVALGDRTTLNELAGYLYEAIRESGLLRQPKLVYRQFRDGDVRHSEADISRIRTELGYSARIRVKEGIQRTVSWALSQ